MKKLAAVLCLMLIAISFCACGNKTPTEIIESKFDLKIPEGAVSEYYHRQKASHWLDYYPGFHYAVYALKEEPTELLESYTFIEKQAGIDVSNSDILYLNAAKTRLSAIIPAANLPDWNTRFLVSNTISPDIWYFPDTLKLIFYFS